MGRVWQTVASAAVALTLVLVLEGCGGGGDNKKPAEVTTCGRTSPSPVADCQNVDFGSCGNACCNLIIKVDQPPHDLVTALQNALSNGFTDEGFTAGEMAEGGVGFANLSAITHSKGLPEPFYGSKSLWIGQLKHTSSGPKHYVDVLNFNMRNGTGNTTILHGFSMSLIGGALGDNGQNYKNIMTVMSRSGLKFEIQEHLNNSCPDAHVAPPSPTPPASPTPPTPKASPVEAKPFRALAGVSAVNGTCGKTKPSPVADCLNVDYGSCGNACCSLVMQQAYSPEKAMQKLNETLSNGGPDGNYKLQMTAGGHLGFDNLTAFVDKLPSPFNKSKSGVYIGQVHHMTSGEAHYNDTISFVIFEPAEGGAYVEATSVSLIGGALGDNGQNFKNINMAMDAAFGKWHDIDSADHKFGSCRAPTLRILV